MHVHRFSDEFGFEVQVEELEMVVGDVGVVIGTVDDSPSLFSAKMVNGTNIPDATRTIVTSSAASKYFFLVCE